MNFCATCRFWGADPTWDESSSWAWDRVRPCRRVKHDDDSGYFPHGQGTIPELAIGEKARVVDGSGYFAELHTADDFGCVLYEPRTP